MITGHQHAAAAGTVVIDFHPAPQRLGFRLVKLAVGTAARDAERDPLAFGVGLMKTEEPDLIEWSLGFRDFPLQHEV